MKRLSAVSTVVLLCLAIPAALAQAGNQSHGSERYLWRNATITGGGFVTGVVAHPARKGLFYARTDIGGAYRWEAGAKRWVSLSDWVDIDTWNATGIESLAIDPSNPDRLYLAAGTYTTAGTGNGWILRSSDQGRTWEHTVLPIKMGGNEDGRFAGERLAVDPLAPATLFFGSRNDGLWKSEDRGLTWAKVTSFPVQGRTNGVGIVFVVFDPGKENDPGKDKKASTIYAGVSSPGDHLYVSKDGGASWSPVAGQPHSLLLNHGEFDGRGSMILTYGDAPGPNGMKAGAVWKWSVASKIWREITPLHPGAGDTFGYGAVAIDPANAATILVGTMDRWEHGDDIFRSKDGGLHWTGLAEHAQRDTSTVPWLLRGKTESRFGHWIGSIAIDPFDSNHAMYVTGEGIWATNDLGRADQNLPTHWEPGAVGLEESVVEEVLSPPTGAPLLSAVWDFDGFRHEDLNRSPRHGGFQPSYGHNTGMDFAGRDPAVVARVYGIQSGSKSTGGAYSRDNGITWSEFAGKSSGTGSGTIAVSADGASFVWSPQGAGVQFSSDHGRTWRASAGAPAAIRIVSDRVNPRGFYGFDRQTGRLYASSDGGATFAVKAGGLPGEEGYLRAVPGKAGHLWLATAAGLFRSLDAGATFTAVSGVPQAYRIGFGKPAPGRSYPAIYLNGRVGGVYGFYRSLDEGATWVRINDAGHQFAGINAITGDPRVFGRVYIASQSRGVLYGEPVR